MKISPLKMACDAPEMYGKPKQFLGEVKLLSVTIMAKIGKSQMFIIFWYVHITVRLQNGQVIFLVIKESYNKNNTTV